MSTGLSVREVVVGALVSKDLLWSIFCRLHWLFSHSLSGGKGGFKNRWAEQACVASVSALGEQIVGMRVGQGALREPAGWVSVLNVVEYLSDEFRLGDICDDTKLPTTQRAQ